MVVLKRLAEAERDGNHIYAVLKNIGIASDGRATHVLAPRLEGEELALAPGLRTGGDRSAHRRPAGSARHRHSGGRRGGSGSAAARISAAPDRVAALRAGFGEIHDQPYRAGRRRGGSDQGGAGAASQSAAAYAVRESQSQAAAREHESLHQHRDAALDSRIVQNAAARGRERFRLRRHQCARHPGGIHRAQPGALAAARLG